MARDLSVTVSASVVDYSEIESFEKKRLLVFLNHFLSRTSNFLNSFSQDCDKRLEAIGKRINQLENSVTILESKLDSVPKD